MLVDDTLGAGSRDYVTQTMRNCPLNHTERNKGFIATQAGMSDKVFVHSKWALAIEMLIFI